MPFNARSAAASAAIFVFFITAGIGAFYNHTPFTNCKRALIAALIACVVTNIIVKIINTMVVNAMITKQVNQRTGNKAK